MAKARRKYLSIERLEDRRVLTQFGVPWPEPSHLTLSFVPDGTMAGNYASNLFAKLNAQMPTHEWQEDILQAFQTWAVQSNINIGLVADGGEPFGTLGLKQSDPRFGDIRIGAFPMGADVLAVSNPYNPFVASTLVGDVFLNSAYVFTNSGGNSTYNLFSVALHEAGHVFGFPDNLDPTSVEYESYPTANSLSAADVAGLQALYGAPKADPFDGTLATATPLQFGATGYGSMFATVAAEIGSLGDVDTYRLVAPQGSQSLTVSVEVAGYSLLTPRVTVLDASGAVLSTAVTTDPLNNNVSISLDHVEPGATYFVQVSSGQNNVFGMGGYELQVKSHTLKSDVPHLSPTEATPSLPTDGTPFLATSSGYSETSYSEQNGIDILGTTPGYVEHTYYELIDSVSPDWPAQTYEVQSADIGPGLTNVMTVVLNYSVNPRVKFNVSVSDDQGNIVPTKTIEDSAGYLEVQVMPVGSAQNYFVTVQSFSPPANGATFDLRVDYALNGNALNTYVSDSLSQGQSSVARKLQVNQSQEFDFVLAATAWSVPTPAGVRMEIENQDGQIVYTMSAANGAQRFGDVLLDEGQYTVIFTRATAGVDTPVAFTLSALTTSDRLGPQLRDTVQEALYSPTASALPQLTFYWLPDDSTLAAVPLVSNQSQASVAENNTNGITSATISSLDANNKAGTALGNTSIAPQTSDDQVTKIFVARAVRLDDLAAAHDSHEGNLVMRDLSGSEGLRSAASVSRRIAGVDSLHENDQVLNAVGSHAILSQHTRFLPAGSSNKLWIESHSSFDLIQIALHERLIDQVFASNRSFESGNYADWTLASISAIFAWYVLNELPEQEAPVRCLPDRRRAAQLLI